MNRTRRNYVDACTRIFARPLPRGFTPLPLTSARLLARELAQAYRTVRQGS